VHGLQVYGLEWLKSAQNQTFPGAAAFGPDAVGRRDAPTARPDRRLYLCIREALHTTALL
jgi:hypothetical protein